MSDAHSERAALSPAMQWLVGIATVCIAALGGSVGTWMMKIDDRQHAAAIVYVTREEVQADLSRIETKLDRLIAAQLGRDRP